MLKKPCLESSGSDSTEREAVKSKQIARRDPLDSQAFNTRTSLPSKPGLCEEKYSRSARQPSYQVMSAETSTIAVGSVILDAW